MFRIIIGIILFVIGVKCVDAAEGWIGAIILGPVLIIQGIRKIQHDSKWKAYNEFFSTNNQGLIDRALNREAIDDIADQLFANYRIPVFLTYNFYGQALIKDDNEDTKHITLKLLKFQKKNAASNIGATIPYFTTDATIIKYDESAQAYLNNKKKSGLLLLSRSHLLFFPDHKSWGETAWEKVWDKLYESPLFFVPLFVDFIFAIKKEVQKPLSKAKLDALKKNYDKGKCITAAFADINKLEIVKKEEWFIGHSCVAITTSNNQQICIGTSETDAKQWVKDISKQIKIIAFAEGRHLA